MLDMLLFEGKSANLTLHLVAEAGWNNLTYQMDVWKTAVGNFPEFATALFKGGPLYVVYLVAYLFGFVLRLPDVILLRYPYFCIESLLRTFLLLVSAFTSALLFRFFRSWVYPLCSHSVNAMPRQKASYPKDKI